MVEILLPLLAAIWLLGAWIRVYQQARYYQIEEYMSRRYLRWVRTHRSRFLPTRPIAASLIGLAIGTLLAEAPYSVFPVIVAVLAALVAVFPQRQGELKKSFAATARMKRLLAGAWIASAIASALAIVLFIWRLPLIWASCA